MTGEEDEVMAVIQEIGATGVFIDKKRLKDNLKEKIQELHDMHPEERQAYIDEKSDWLIFWGIVVAAVGGLLKVFNS